MSFPPGTCVSLKSVVQVAAAWLFSGLLLPGMLGASTDLPVRNAQSPMGLNVGGLADWSVELPFVDVFRAARPFSSMNPDLKLDEHGWPTSLESGQVGETLLLWDLGDTFPGGLYTVMFDGEGEIRFGGGARAVRKAEGRYWVNVNPRIGGIHFKMTRTNPENPIRNVRVIMPGGVCGSNPLKRVERAKDCKEGDYSSFVDTYETQIFNPDYLNLLADFKVLRFMDYFRINGSKVVDWDDRGQLDDATWTTHSGGPVEIMVELNNRLRTDTWVTIPHQANDRYVREMAGYLKDNLAADLKIYLEYSNEAWNGVFPQFRYMVEQGKKHKLGADQYQGGMHYFARRSVEIFKIFEEVLGGKERLIRVMPGQAANPYILKTLLAFEGAHEHTDALAIAPYFGGSLGSPNSGVENMSLGGLFSTLRKDSMPESIEWINMHAKIAKQYKLDMLAYEGGHHLAGHGGAENNKKLNALFDKADVNVQMGSLYDRYFDAWKKAGGKTFVYYQSVAKPSKWGRWGMAYRLNAPEGESPKKDAILRFIKDNPTWW